MIKNLTGSTFTPGAIIFLNIDHTGLVMAMLAAGMYGIVFNKNRIIANRDKR